MKQFASIMLGILSLGLVATAGTAGAQGMSPLVGTWTAVSVTNTLADGTQSKFFGPSPLGMLVFTADGRFSLILVRPDLPKIAANNRQLGTADENKAIVQGTLAYFGTYTVDPVNKTYTQRVSGSNYANWNGTDQVRTYTINGDTLTTNTLAAPSGGAAITVWSRMR